MSLDDTLSAAIESKISIALARSQGTGVMSGRDLITHNIKKSVIDGSGTGQAIGGFTCEIPVPITAATISLADSVDPTGALGTEEPSCDPENTKLRYLKIENLDTTNFVTLKIILNTGSKLGVVGLLGSGGTTDDPTLKINAGGYFEWYDPKGSTPINDAADDEITLTADTAPCQVRLTYMFG